MLRKRTRRERDLDELLKDASKIAGGDSDSPIVISNDEVTIPTVAAKPPRKKAVGAISTSSTERPAMVTPVMQYQQLPPMASTHAAVLTGLNASATTPSLLELAEAAIQSERIETLVLEDIEPLPIVHSETHFLSEDTGTSFSENLDASTDLFSNTTLCLIPSFKATALHHAVYKENIDLLKQLLEANAIPVDSVDQSGFTALLMAVYTGNRELVRLLLAAGANKNFGYTVDQCSPLGTSINLMFKAKQEGNEAALSKYAEIHEEFCEHNLSQLPKF
jgi:hypothetical protein